MPLALLDHPWPVHEGLEESSPAWGVLLKYADRIREHGLTPVPFLTEQQRLQLIEAISSRPEGMGANGAAILRFAENLVRRAERTDEATPQCNPAPALSIEWKRALRDALDEPANWRDPHIVVPESRQSVWPHAHEVAIQCSDRPEAPPEIRCLVRIDDYQRHPFALTDLDAWQHLLHRNAPKSENPRIQHPCILPRPRLLSGVALENLADRLPGACRAGWCVADRYYFIPAPDYAPMLVAKAHWREGRAFPVDRGARRHWFGPVDYAKRVWEWDINERHWDVQIPGNGYLKISHDGRVLKCSSLDPI